VKPYWQELFATITGTPAIDTGGGGGSSMDWNQIHTYGQQRWAELEVNRKSQDLVNQGLACRDFQKDCFVKICSELYYDRSIPLELFWKAGVPEYGNPEDVKQKLRSIGEDIIVDRPVSQYKDVVQAMGHQSASWNAAGGGSPVTGNDLNRCGRPPNVGLLEPPKPPEPPSGDVGVIAIPYHDATTRRSDQYGMRINYDIYATSAVVEVEFDLEGDGTPSIIQTYRNEPARDGRYVRGLFFKATVPGTWPIRLKATDSAGNRYESDGSHLVTVTD
jgi:hypothetical protein